MDGVDDPGAAPWYRSQTDGDDSLFRGRHRAEADRTYRTLTYQVTGRVARITFDRPQRGNAITADTPIDLAAAVERADLDPRVHVILLSGRGKGFCGGYDLSIFAEGTASDDDTESPEGTVVDPIVQARNHDPAAVWDPMIDYAMMSRFNRGFASLMHANKPTVAKLHGFAIAGGTDIALFAIRSSAPTTLRSATPRHGCGVYRRRGCGRIVSATNARKGSC